MVQRTLIKGLISGIKVTVIFLGIMISSVAFGQQMTEKVAAIYSYPARNSEGISTKTTIGIRYEESLSESSLEDTNFLVTGEFSGIHPGKTVMSLDRKTIIFTPDISFSYGEEVNVHIKPLSCISGKSTTPYSLIFRISKTPINVQNILQKLSENTSSVSRIESPPWLSSPLNSNDTLPADFPKIYVTQSNNPAPGDIYLANFKFTSNYTGAYLIKIDNQGNVLFERSMVPDYAEGFRPQAGNRYTYFDHDASRYQFYVMDSNFVVIDSIAAANGYLTDGHELIFLPGGGYALIAQADEMVNMKKYYNGGDSNTTVIEGIVQEFDAKKHLVFEWLTKDHFSFRDRDDNALAVPFLDFTHCNSLENDGDTAFLLSSRELDEVTKISRKDGHIIWRWGGIKNQFTFSNDSIFFSHQHYVKRLPNDNIIMFDNGFGNTPQVSRAVEYNLDEQSKRATKVWEYYHNPKVYGNSLGSVQQLDNGNRLIGWGGCDSVAVTEVKPDGSTALEIKFDPQTYSYRALKFRKDEFSAGVSSQALPSNISLGQNYPNPFSKSSTIEFHVDRRTSVELVLYDVLGRVVKTLFNGTVDAGTYSAKCDAETLPSGEYFYKLSTPSATLTRIMFLSK